MTRESGWDIFTPAPGTQQSMRCRVCKTEMNVQRDQVVSKNYVETELGGHKCDIFTCPHSDDAWHRQALALHQWIQDTPSATLAILVQRELNNILKNKKSTKEQFNKLMSVG